MREPPITAGSAPEVPPQLILYKNTQPTFVHNTGYGAERPYGVLYYVLQHGRHTYPYWILLSYLLKLPDRFLSMVSCHESFRNNPAGLVTILEATKFDFPSAKALTAMEPGMTLLIVNENQEDISSCALQNVLIAPLRADESPDTKL